MERGGVVQLAARPHGAPSEADFRVVQADVRAPADGELLVRNTWMSVDPSTRVRMDADAPAYLPAFAVGAPLEGWAVGEVVASRADGFSPGDTVLHPLGWREMALLRADGGGGPAPERVAVDDRTPARAYLGPLSWVGLTSYVGLLDVAQLRAGDVVFVSGAAGAVGGLAVQIAKLRGHVVVASAGSAEKVAFVREQLGADAAFCYRDGDVGEQLAACAPDGIDVYFDNVGGDHLQAAIDALRPHGRVALCGAVSTYDALAPVPGPSNLFLAVAKGLTLRGFLARMYADRMEPFRAQMRSWLAEELITYPETTFRGLDQAPRALVALLRGESRGKVLVDLR